MPGYRTHDFLTVIAAGASATGYWQLAASPRFAEGALLAGACLLSGLLFSPDLDVASRPRRRWGPAAILWWPYTRFIRHRSRLSHGALVGPALRLGYFLSLLYFLTWWVLWVINQWVIPVNRNTLVRGWRQDLLELVQGNPRETALLLGGFFLGALTHTVADAVVSAARRRRRQKRRRR